MLPPVVSVHLDKLRHSYTHPWCHQNIKKWRHSNTGHTLPLVSPLQIKLGVARRIAQSAASTSTWLRHRPPHISHRYEPQQQLSSTQFHLSILKIFHNRKSRSWRLASRYSMQQWKETSQCTNSKWTTGKCGNCVHDSSRLKASWISLKTFRLRFSKIKLTVPHLNRALTKS